MKILLDCSILGAGEYPHQRATFGIVRVAEHIVHALLTADPSKVEPLFTAAHNRAASRRYFRTHLASRAANPQTRFVDPALPGRPLREAVTAAEDFLATRYVHPPWRWLGSARALRYAAFRLLSLGVDPAAAAGLDIYHSPYGDLPGWARRRKGLRRFLTVYDLAPLKHPKFFAANAPRLIDRNLDSLRPEDRVLCISESTRRDFLEYRPMHDPARARVIPLAAEPFFHPVSDLAVVAEARKRYGVPPDAPYFLSVSTMEPRKNFETVIRAFAEFVRDNPTRPASLVLVGKAGWDAHPVFAALGAQGAGLRARIVTPGYVPDADLAALYAGATAFIYLSFYEGFGLPVLEAMQCGTPVISSNASSLPEVVGEGGTLLAPTDVDGVCAAMLALHSDEEFRSRQSEIALAQARHFSWERFEAQHLEAYHRALDES